MPYKDFTVGQILTSAEVDDFLMRQAVMVFDNSTQRGTALSGVVSQGMITYLKDVNRLEQYNGTAWSAVSNPGDITAVTAGTGLTGGGLSGDVTLNVNYAAVGSAIPRITNVVAGTALTGGGTTSTVTLNVNQSALALAGSQVVFGATAVSAAFTATAALENSTIWVNGTAAVTITVPDVLAVGDSINILRNSGGTVTIAAGSGVTDWAGVGTAGTAVTFKIDQIHNGAQVIKVAANTYRVIGKVVP